MAVFDNGKQICIGSMFLLFVTVFMQVTAIFATLASVYAAAAILADQGLLPLEQAQWFLCFALYACASCLFFLVGRFLQAAFSKNKEA